MRKVFFFWLKSLQVRDSFSRKWTRWRWREWETQTLIPSRNGNQIARALTYVSGEKTNKTNKILFHSPHAIGVDRLNDETATPCIVPARVPQTILRFFLVFFFMNSTSYANYTCPKWNDCWLPVCCVCRLAFTRNRIQQIGRPRRTGNSSLRPIYILGIKATAISRGLYYTPLTARGQNKNRKIGI
jgi:hypothetical protein